MPCIECGHPNFYGICPVCRDKIRGDVERWKFDEIMDYKEDKDGPGLAGTEKTWFGRI